MDDKTNPTIQDVIKTYNLLVKGIDAEARVADLSRAYGGMVRSGKGELVEDITQKIVRIAWRNLGGDQERISFEKGTIKVPIKRDYIDKLEDEEVRQYILDNINKYTYQLKTDVRVCIDKKFVIGIECKAYTENAMMKRIMVDFMFLKGAHPNVQAVLLQLESQLGGDYSNIFQEVTMGSRPTHTIMSYFDVNLLIITLIEGDRKVDQPIHKKETFKGLKEQSIIKAVQTFEDLLRQHIKQH